MDQLGDYRLLEELGRGTTGRVFAASRWPALGGEHLFAVKLLESELARNDRFVTLLHDGIAKYSAFEHPSIVPVLDVAGNAEQLLVVSELVDGQPLDRVLRHWTERESHVDPIISLWVIERVASVLSAAHGFGLIHGFLAPDQVLVTYDGEVRLLGLSMQQARGVLAANGRRRPFLAPEVLRTGVATPASDVHGLARLLHHMLAGSNSVMATPGVDAPAWLPPLRSYGVAIHPALEGLVERMLAASPKARPSIEEVEAALGSALSARGPTSRGQMSRVLQTGFTTELAAAKLRRQRAARPDEVRSGDEFFVPRLPSRSLTDPGAPGFQAHATEPNGPMPNGAHPPRSGLRSGDGAASRGWIETASLEDLAARDVFNGVFHHGEVAGASAPGVAVRAADPRLQALESGNDEDLMALVDEIVRPLPSPQASRPDVGAFDDDDPLDVPLLLEDEADVISDSVEILDDVSDGADQGFADGLFGPAPRRSSEAEAYGLDGRDAQFAPRTTPRGGYSAHYPERAETQTSKKKDPLGERYPVNHADLPDVSDLLSAANEANPLTPPPPEPTEPIHRSVPQRSPFDDLDGLSVEARGERQAAFSPEQAPDDDAVYGSEESEDIGLPLPEPLPPEAIFTTEVPRLPAGTVIGERYKIEEVIGEGGVSVVYRCSHSFLRKDVAIKVLRPELASMPPVVERFHREARSVAQLDHPNIVRVIDFGKSSSGSLFLVMDLIEGTSLADQLEREGWLAPTNAVRIAISILTGLEHAHSRGVIHRDLKPDNIMILGAETGPAEVKILDFGIAKLGDVEIGSRPITEAGMVFGTPRYMSPEQAAGEPVDHRSDLFAIGIILYQLLSGQLPFDGETTVQILRRVLTQPAPRLMVNGLPSTTSEALADVVARALAKNPEERFPSARVMREALQSCFPL